MTDAREVMDRVSAALLNRDYDALGLLYAQDVVVVTPDAGELTGRQAVVEYFRQQALAFPDSGYETARKHESGNVAIDEGYFTATHTEALPMPSGETVPPTGKKVRIRACDLATVVDGVITEHHIYFDQMEFFGQLGLLPEGF